MTVLDEAASLPGTYTLSVQTLRDGVWTEVDRHCAGAHVLEELGHSAVGLGVDPGVWVRVELIHADEVVGCKEFRSTDSAAAATPLVADVRRVEESVGGPVAVDSATRRRARLLVEISSRHTQAPGKLECRCGYPYPPPAAPDAPRLHAAEQVLVALGSAEMLTESVLPPHTTALLGSVRRGGLTPPQSQTVARGLADVVDALTVALREADVSLDAMHDLYTEQSEQLRDTARHLGWRDRAVDRLHELVAETEAKLRARNRVHGRSSRTIGEQRAQLARVREQRAELRVAAAMAQAEITDARTTLRAELGLADGVDLGALTLGDLLSRYIAEVEAARSVSTR